MTQFPRKGRAQRVAIKSLPNIIRQLVRTGLCALLLAASAVLAGCAGSAGGSQPVLRFTAIPDQDRQYLDRRFEALSDYLREALGIPVAYVPVNSYVGAVKSFVSGDVDFAWFGGLSGEQARHLSPGAEAIVQGVEDQRFSSVLIARRGRFPTPDSATDKLPEAIIGHSLTFGDRYSTSGRLMPEHFLRGRFSRAPEDLFQRIGYSGDHSRTIAMVAEGTFELGMMSAEVWDHAVASNDPAIAKLTALWRSPPFHDYQWTVREDLERRFGKGFSKRLADTLIAIDDPDLLALFSRSGFIPARNFDFAPIRLTAKTLGLLDPT